MSLEIPDLDDRTYEEIVDDARRRIPVYADQWTDHNASDPGITLLELLAWVAETYTYQLDRVTDAHRLKYLALLGEQPRPPRPATVDLNVSLPETVGHIEIEPSAKLYATDDADRTYGFETTEHARLTSARLARVVTDGDRGRIDHSAANRMPGMHFAPFDESATAESALYLGFEGDPFAGDIDLSLAVRLHEVDLPEPATYGASADSWSEPEDFEPPVEVQWEHYVPEDGEASNGAVNGVWKPMTVANDDTRADRLVNRFYRSGQIVLEYPEKNWKKEPVDLFTRDERHQWIRCVLKTGTYEISPRIDSIELNIVRVEHRWTVDREGDPEPLESTNDDATGGRFPSGNWARSTGLPDQTFGFTLPPPFAAEVNVGRERVTTLLVDDDSAPTVLVDGVDWEQRDDFDGTGPRDEVFVLDPARGAVTFGDGSRGKLPPEGARITTTRYVVGGGVEGNLPPSTTWAFAAPLLPGVDADEGVLGCRSVSGQFMKADLGHLTVTQPAAATGGVDAESVEEAFDRLQEDRLEPYRMVSLADYEHVATHTPGLRFGRAAARLVTMEAVERPSRSPVVDSGCGHGTGNDVEPGVPGSHTEAEKPEAESSSTDGAGGGTDETGEVHPGYCEPHHQVRVVVVPYSRSSRPTPSDNFRAAVQRHLDRHRLVTDRVVVEAPRYVEIGVTVEVRLDAGFGVTDREEAVREALDEFLDPLRGFEGDGWPFGRDVYPSELYEVIEGVRGVDCVTRLDIRPPPDREVAADGGVAIDDEELPTPVEHTVTAQFDPRASQCGREA
ncbi:baseplate J/gp47 family protein [Halobium salinum]|uniref:Baseplate J/gp47 family protein n=1 Tax=Halobium salinum TaxID=1364940 RepID=A0ABD5PIP4_9EURY|nr:baseplate J/gp47 family protein [Halobium salinum]